MHTKRGFTLIELLVVIAIIAILAAILFPIFANAKDTAIRTTCLNNLKQMGGALTRYADDYGGYLPDTDSIDDVCSNLAANRSKFLYIKLEKYTGKNRAIWQCPGDTFRYDKDGKKVKTYFESYEASYQNYSDRDTKSAKSQGYDCFDSDLYVYGARGIWPVIISVISKPSATRLIRDAAMFHSRKSAGNFERAFNELFADGHCARVKCVDGDPVLGLGRDRGGIL